MGLFMRTSIRINSPYWFELFVTFCSGNYDEIHSLSEGKEIYFKQWLKIFINIPKYHNLLAINYCK